MEKIFTAGPGQNIDWAKNGLERGVPHLLANSLNRIETRLNGDQSHVELQMWNNNTPKTVEEWKIAQLENPDISFDDYTCESIKNKNRILENAGYNTCNANLEVITDTDPILYAWINEKISQCIKNGIIYEERSQFHICNNCGNNIAEACVEIDHSCKLCGSTDIKTKYEKALFIDIPDDKESLIFNKIYSPIKDSAYRGLLNRFKLMPPRIFLNKRRFVGALLDRIGYEGFVVDPKLVISIMPEYFSNEKGIDEVVQIQSMSTATNTIPYTSILNNGSYKNSYIFINKAPAGILSELNHADSEYYSRLLGELSSRTKPMRIDEYMVMQKDYLKVRKGLVDSFLWMDAKDTTDVINLEKEVVDIISAIREFLLNGNYQLGLESARKLANKYIIHEYARKCKEQHTRLENDDLIALRLVLEPIYGVL